MTSSSYHVRFANIKDIVVVGQTNELTVEIPNPFVDDSDSSIKRLSYILMIYFPQDFSKLTIHLQAP